MSAYLVVSYVVASVSEKRCASSKGLLISRRESAWRRQALMCRVSSSTDTWEEKLTADHMARNQLAEGHKSPLNTRVLCAEGCFRSILRGDRSLLIPFLSLCCVRPGSSSAQTDFIIQAQKNEGSSGWYRPLSFMLYFILFMPFGSRNSLLVWHARTRRSASLSTNKGGEAPSKPEVSLRHLLEEKSPLIQ